MTKEERQDLVNIASEIAEILGNSGGNYINDHLDEILEQAENLALKVLRCV